MRIHLAAIFALILATTVLARIPASLAGSGVGGPMERSSLASDLDKSHHHSKSHHGGSGKHHTKSHHGGSGDDHSKGHKSTSKLSTVTSPSVDGNAINGAHRSSSDASSLLESASSKNPGSEVQSQAGEDSKSADDAAASIVLGSTGMLSGSCLIALSAVVVAGAIFA